MLEIIKAIIIGLVEGITEWLPISSTGHMILLDEFLKLNVSDAFMEMFLVVIQLGAIMAVVVLYWNKLFPFKFKGGFKIELSIITIWFKIIVATIPAAVNAGIVPVYRVEKILAKLSVLMAISVKFNTARAFNANHEMIMILISPLAYR